MDIEQRQLEYSNGVYYAKIDITTEEWETMLLNRNIFNEKSMDMVLKWYRQVDHQATNKEIMAIYSSEYPNHKATPFNGIVVGLAKRIIDYLKRFEVMDKHGEKSYFIIPFEGWHEGYIRSNPFVWKIRNELAEAMEKLGLVTDCNMQ